MNEAEKLEMQRLQEKIQRLDREKRILQNQVTELQQDKQIMANENARLSQANQRLQQAMKTSGQTSEATTLRAVEDDYDDNYVENSA